MSVIFCMRKSFSDWAKNSSGLSMFIFAPPILLLSSRGG